MGQINTREVCLLQSTTATTNGTGSDINVIQGWQAAIVSVNISTASGTSPTLNVVVQNKLGQWGTGDLTGGFLSGTAIYDDLLAYTQMTTTGTRIMRLCTGPLFGSANATVVTSADYATLDGTLTVGNLRVGPIGGQWRVKFVIGGTSPSFTFSVVTQLIPFST